MPFCASCGAAHADGQRFCAECGARLAVAPAVAERERKVVSVLFCDLVGFTAASDGADPEEVQARLSPYHARAREVIEGFSGTVEKFIGDAVMAAFGAPVVHEDDPERAVRAGLALLAAVEDLNAEHDLGLAVRVGVATGEAVVSTGARPERGEGMLAGDVVNTAARLQTAAPVGRVLVGQATHDATRAAIEYEPHDPIVVKGKTEPLPVWTALRPRGTTGEALADRTRPMIGRDDELSALQRAFSRSVREQSVHLVTVVGDAGMGKSRLLEAFRSWIEDREELVYWRQGRCPSYGDAVAYAALGQVVKAQAGILDSDPTDVVAAKLTDAVAALADATDLGGQEGWLVARLGPLVGLPGVQTAQAELFTAWRRFVEAMAVQSPFVLVVEDLHWADPALLDFLTHLLEWVVGVPLVIVTTTRPELYDATPGWGSGHRNLTTLTLAPLLPAETAQLAASLLGSRVLPATLHAALLARSAGNPLYTREYLAMLDDQSSVQTPDGTAVEVLADRLPGTVQAVIAARLDTLPPESKRLLQAAAVVGATFWVGAVAALTGTERAEVAQRLHDLVRRDYLRPVRLSTVAGEAEYAFGHALIADVAYAQLPRAARATHHRTAADWHRSTAPAGLADVSGVDTDDLSRAGSGDLAAVLAHHYTRAHELTVAAGDQPAQTAELAEYAVRWHLVAARQASAVDLVAAEQHAQRAADLAGRDGRQLVAALLLLGRIRSEGGNPTAAEAALSRGRDVALTMDDQVAAAAVDVCRGWLSHYTGHLAEGIALLEHAALILQDQPAGDTLAEALYDLAFLALLSGNVDRAVTEASRGLAWIEATTRPSDHATARLLRVRGSALMDLADPSGEADLLSALQLTRHVGDSRLEVGTLIDLAMLAEYRGPADAGLAYRREGHALTRDRGYTEVHLFSSGELTLTLAGLGRIDEAGRVFEAALRLAPSSAGTRSSIFFRLGGTALRLARADAAGAAELLAPDAATAGGYEPAVAALWLTQVLRCRSMDGALAVAGLPSEADASRRLVSLLADDSADTSMREYLPHLSRCLAAAGHPEMVERIIGHCSTAYPLFGHQVSTARAVVVEHRGDHRAAVDLHRDNAQAWAAYGHVLEEIEALLGAGRCLLRVGADATPELTQALEKAGAIGATALARQADALLRGD